MSCRRPVLRVRPTLLPSRRVSLPFFSLDLAMYLQLRAAEIRDIIHEEE